MKNAIIGSAIAIATSTAAIAAPITVAGVTWDPDQAFIDFAAQSAVYETNVNAIGDDLYGIGKVSQFNGQNESSFCPGCQLTFEFGYTVSDIGDFDSNGTIDVIFTDGWLKFYVDSSTSFDFTNTSTATDGILFLELAGHEDFDPLLGKYGDLFGELDLGFALSDNNEEGEGSGLFDVVGGAAAANFDTNTKDDFFNADVADFNFTSSFQPFNQGGSTADGLALVGTSELIGDSIPEPGMLALMGAGLLGFTAMRRRKNSV